jgi:hypothetical protein
MQGRQSGIRPGLGIGAVDEQHSNATLAIDASGVHQRRDTLRALLQTIHRGADRHIKKLPHPALIFLLLASLLPRERRDSKERHRSRSVLRPDPALIVEYVPKHKPNDCNKSVSVISPDHTLEPNALVNELCVRLFGSQGSLRTG